MIIKRESFCGLAILAAATLAASPAAAVTSAYWRFEEIIRLDNSTESPPAVGAELFTTGPNGDSDLTSDDGVGGLDFLRTFNNSNEGNPTSPSWSADVPSATVPATAAANTRSTFYPEGAIFTDDIYTIPTAAVTTADFTAYTIEASFKTPRLDSFQIVMGKDGPSARAFLDNSGQLISPQPAFSGGTTTAPLGTFELGFSPFQMKLFGSNFTDFLTDPTDGNIQNKLVIEMVDDTSEGNTTTTSGIHRLVSDNAIQADTWYSVAVVNNGTTASLYLTDPSTGAYVLQDTEAVSGAFGGRFNTADAGNINSIWTVGRGWLTRFQHQADGPDPDTLQDRVFQGDIRDWFQGNIDEVRISDVALAPADFLFAVDAPAGNADFDNDGDVDGADFLILQRGNGQPGGPGMGDANGDGQVNSADVLVFRQQFGDTGLATAAGGAVPEPSSLLLAVGAAIVIAGARRRLGM